jgi:hypothetical protein
MTETEFKKLRKKSENDLTITKKNVLEKSLQIPKLLDSYIKIFTKEYHDYKNLLAKKKKKYGELYEHFKFKSKYTLDKKSEIEPFIYGDDDFFKISKQCNDQEMICKFLENIIDTLKSMSFNIKNFIDYNKFLNGE